MAEAGTAYVKIEIDPESRDPLAKLVDERVSARLASLGGRLLEAHGVGAPHENEALAALGGYLTQEEQS